MENVSSGSGSSSSSGSSKGNNARKRRTRQHTSEGIDYISHLPKAILLHILSFLPLEYRIIMSFVSRPWKYLWTQFSNLNLDELEMIEIIRRDPRCPLCGEIPSPHNPNQCLRHSVQAARRKFVELVDRTLLLHSGCTINNFRLSFHYDAHDGYASRINMWIHFAMTSNIKELELNFSQGTVAKISTREGLVVRPTDLAQLYESPHHCFAPKILRTLILKFCKFRASSFRVFGSLRRLSLLQVDVLDFSIGDLVSKCPVLEDLSMEYCFLPNDFMVCAQDLKIKRLSLIYCTMDEWLMFPIDISIPNLLNLILVGAFLMTSSVKNALHLVDVTIDVRQIFADHVQGDIVGSLLTNLNHCQTLTLTTWCIQVLPTGENFLQQLPTPLNLKHLRLGVGLVKQELPGISCLLRSCPNLESLTLDINKPSNVDWDAFRDLIPNVFDFEEYTYWESQSFPFHCLQNCLKKVKINGFVGRSNEMQLVLFLLKNATILEDMAIFTWGTNMFVASTPQQQTNYMQFQYNNLHKLLNCPRASTQARIAIF